MSLWGTRMQTDSVRAVGGYLQGGSNIAQTCAYNRSGVCILSDCKCQAMSDGKLVCSSYKEKQ